MMSIRQQAHPLGGTPGIAGYFSRSNESSGNTHPVANFATPKATADAIENGQGNSKDLSEKEVPKIITTSASQYVGNESSGNTQPVATCATPEAKADAIEGGQ